MKIFLVYIFIISTYFIVFLDEAQVIQLAREDGIIESFGAVFFLAASAFLITAYFNSSGHGNKFWKLQTRRNIFYLLLGLLMLVCCGEEISWGQRLIGWDTPEAIKGMNMQNETNLHNLDIFYAKGPNAKDRTGVSRIFNLLTLFSLFWLAYFVLVPLANRVSQWMRGFFHHLGLPIPPLWIGGLFITNYVLFKLLNIEGLGFEDKVLESINELKESNYAFNYAVFGMYSQALMLASAKNRSRQNLPEGEGIQSRG
jgi:hypothetical protein